ncbi:MAG: hypothetical protein AVDCRST_MAG05-4281, partial [uncultured Rubrobacteraceae bacterium]
LRGGSRRRTVSRQPARRLRERHGPHRRRRDGLPPESYL